MVLHRGPDDPLTDGLVSAVTHFWWWARTNANLVPCTVRWPLGVELLDGSGRRLDVQGNPLAVTSVADLPEAGSAAKQPGMMEFQLRWWNWCGERPAFMRWIGPGGRSRAAPVTEPPCIDRSKPSRLMVERTSRQRSGPAGPAGRIVG